MADETSKNTTTEILERNEIPVVELKDENHPRYLEHKERIIKLHQDGAITQAQMTAVTALAPHLTDLSKSIAETATVSQSAVLDAHKKTSSDALRIQEKIIDKTQSEALLGQISNNIASMNKNNNETQKQLNKNNNGLYKKLGFGLAVAAIGGIAGLLIKKK